MEASRNIRTRVPTTATPVITAIYPLIGSSIVSHLEAIHSFKLCNKTNVPTRIMRFNCVSLHSLEEISSPQTGPKEIDPLNYNRPTYIMVDNSNISSEFYHGGYFS